MVGKADMLVALPQGFFALFRTSIPSPAPKRKRQNASRLASPLPMR